MSTSEFIAAFNASAILDMLILWCASKFTTFGPDRFHRAYVLTRCQMALPFETSTSLLVLNGYHLLMFKHISIEIQCEILTITMMNQQQYSSFLILKLNIIIVTLCCLPSTVNILFTICVCI